MKDYSKREQKKGAKKTKTLWQKNTTKRDYNNRIGKKQPKE